MVAIHSSRARVTLPTDEQILITRHFDAPVHLVYRAYTTAELVSRWWIGERGQMTSCQIDLRPGGRWRYVMMTNQGFEVAFHGVYREIVTDRRIVSTEIYEGMPEAEALSTVTFTAADGGTDLAILVEHTEKAHRDAHVDSGMEAGLQEALDRLEALVTDEPR